jgi:hypothetical protein
MGNWLAKWMHGNQAEDEPCPHIKPYLNGIADGSMPNGPVRRFVRLHLKDCSYCDKALYGLILLRARLYNLKENPGKSDPLDKERRVELEAGWDAIDAKMERKTGAQ